MPHRVIMCGQRLIPNFTPNTDATANPQAVQADFVDQLFNYDETQK